MSPVKAVSIKNIIREWFNGEIAKAINKRDKLYKRLQSPKLNIDEDNYTEKLKRSPKFYKKEKNLFSRKS